MVNTARCKRPFTREEIGFLNTSAIVNHFLAAASARRRGCANVDERPSREILEGRNFLSPRVPRAFFATRYPSASVREYRTSELRIYYLLSYSREMVHTWCLLSCNFKQDREEGIESFIRRMSKNCRERETPSAGYRILDFAAFSWRMFHGNSTLIVAF